jgi:Flp pilus assembly protein TadB
MSSGAVIGLVAIMGAFLSGAFLLYFVVFPRRQTNLRAMMSGGTSSFSQSDSRTRTRTGNAEEDFEAAKSAAKKKIKGKAPVTMQERFFHAGMFTEQERKQFGQIRLIAPIVLPLVLGLSLVSAGSTFAIFGLIFGVLLGVQLPFSILDRRIKQRSEDILFYLPLVVEQIVIGVSSSLDIGPCLQRVVQMSDERDSHNPVTELLRHAQLLSKSGLSLSESLMEVGKLSGHNELKHTFMSLSQVSKHGGEITKQLQELADAVSSQRETKVEAKIKRLELEATGPVGLVFVGFMLIFTIGFGTQLLLAFGGQ